MNERLGKVSFWIMFIGFNLAFFTMHLLGVRACPGAFTPTPRAWDGDR